MYFLATVISGSTMSLLTISLIQFLLLPSGFLS
jgi:hypothetical protein